MMQGIWQDLRFAANVLVKERGVTVVTVLTLALGIGANTAIFSVANAFLLRPLPVHEPDQLASVFTSYAGGDTHGITSYPDYRDLRDGNDAFSGLAAQSFVPVSLRHGEGAEIVACQIVSWNFFDVLGVTPLPGRAFTLAEDETPEAHPVAIISHRWWVQKHDAAADIVGRTVHVNDRPFTVIGVAPEDFTGLSAIIAPDVWVPTMMVNQAFAYPINLEGRGDPWLTLIGRLKPGMSLSQAQADLSRLAAVLEQEHEENEGKGFTLLEANQARILPTPETTITAKRFTALLMAIVGLVLLIACFNVANLHLARATGRQREIALRMSLGASRWRIVRQLLTESTLLALLAGGVGLLATSWTTAFLAGQELSAEFPLEVDFSIDPRVLAFAALISLATGLLFGLAPAAQTLREGQFAALRGQAQSVSPARSGSRLQAGLVIGQVAISVVLLVCAGMFLEGLSNARAVDPGFALRNGLVVPLNLGYGDHSEAEGKEFFRRLISQASSLPGVESVSLATALPLGEMHGHHDVEIEGYEPQPDEHMLFKRNMFDARFLDTMGIRVVRGRGFDRRDQADTQPVAIVNETMASRFWPGGDAVGHVLKADLGVPRTVVGIIADGKYGSLGEAPQPYLAIPLSQAEYVQRLYLVVRTASEPGAVAPALEREIRQMDPALPLSIATMAERLERSVGNNKGAALLVTTFGLLALALAMVGVYGVVAYMVSQRSHEFGVRMALGARGREIVDLVLRRGVRTALVGAGLGLTLAAAATQLLSGFVFGVDGVDLAGLGVVSLALVGTTLVACGIPACFAARVDPMTVLRGD